MARLTVDAPSSCRDSRGAKRQFTAARLSDFPGPPQSQARE